jgi:hypothetical protein
MPMRKTGCIRDFIRKFLSFCLDSIIVDGKREYFGPVLKAVFCSKGFPKKFTCL